jgi:hypothetical protein
MNHTSSANSPFGMVNTNPWQGVFGKRINIIEPKFTRTFTRSRDDSVALPDNDV